MRLRVIQSPVFVSGMGWAKSNAFPLRYWCPRLLLTRPLMSQHSTDLLLSLLLLSSKSRTVQHTDHHDGLRGG